MCQKRSFRLLTDDGALVARQGNDELGECAGLGLDINLAAVSLNDDVMSHRQAEPRSFSGRLGGEEGIEHLFPHVSRDAGAVIANPDFDRLAEIPSGRAEYWLEDTFAVLGLAPGCGIET